MTNELAEAERDKHLGDLAAERTNIAFRNYSMMRAADADDLRDIVQGQVLNALRSLAAEKDAEIAGTVALLRHIHDRLPSTPEWETLKVSINNEVAALKGSGQ